jgi:hypothetical protein
MTGQDIIVFILMFVQLFIGIKVIQLYRLNNSRNFLWLALFLLGGAVFNFFASPSFGNRIVLQLHIPAVQTFALLFVSETFYQDRKSPIRFFLPVLLIVYAAQIVSTVLLVSGDNQQVAQIPSILSGVVVVMVWGWHLVAAYQAYSRLAGDATVEDWIKSRYRYMIVYCIFLLIPGIILIIPPPLWLGIIGALSVILTIILLYLVWVMPERFRLYLNRNYTPVITDEKLVADLSEEEIMGQLKQG